MADNFNPRADDSGQTIGRALYRWFMGFYHLLVLRQGGAEPTAGMAGNVQLYAKADGRLYTMDKDGVEREITNDDIAFLTAGENLSGHRIFRVGSDSKAYYADSANIAHAAGTFGMTLDAALSGAAVRVAYDGMEITEGSWSWTPGILLYLNGSGIVSATPPSSGFSKSIGKALTATTVRLQLGEAIVLA